MVTLVQARRDLYIRFITAWEAGPNTAKTFDGEQFTPPAGQPWIRFVVRHDGSTLEAIGGTGAGGFNKYQRTGRVVIQVFVPTNQGLEDADTLAQAARAIFEGITLSSNAIRFNNAVVREIGTDEDNAWFQINVEAFFQYDERK